MLRYIYRLHIRVKTLPICGILHSKSVLPGGKHNQDYKSHKLGQCQSVNVTAHLPETVQLMAGFKFLFQKSEVSCN